MIHRLTERCLEEHRQCINCVFEPKKITESPCKRCIADNAVSCWYTQKEIVVKEAPEPSGGQFRWRVVTSGKWKG